MAHELTLAVVGIDFPNPDKSGSKPKALPFTYLCKGKYWYFRHAKIGREPIKGEPFGPQFLANYRRLMDRAGERVAMKGANRILRANEAGASYYRLYFIGIEPDGPVKIGLATNVQRRLGHLQVGSPYPLRLLAECEGSVSLESELHQRFAASHMRGEWFERSPELTVFVAALASGT